MEKTEIKGKYRYFYSYMDGNVMVKFTDDPEFGTSDYMEKYYCPYTSGKFSDIDIEFSIYEVSSTKMEDQEKYYEFLVDFGSFCVETVAFDSCLSMLNFFNKYKVSIDKKIKVKEFFSSTAQIEKLLNDFLSLHLVDDIIDIKYTDSDEINSALLIYRE